MKARIGIDFGYKYTGIALLDGDNKVLGGRVIEHRTDISALLKGRRERRSARRRNSAKRRRLRDFYALLCGMGLQPQNARPGEKMTNAERVLPGNRLYALAHHRGWDYAEINELLVKVEDGKSPQKTDIVKTTDRILIQKYGAPAVFDDKVKKFSKKITDAQFIQLKNAAQDAIVARGELLRANPATLPPQLDDKHLRFARLSVCFLGELHRLESEEYADRKEMDKTATTAERKEELASEIELLAQQSAEIYTALQGEKSDIEQWIGKRADAVYKNALSPNTKDNIIGETMTHLGLDTAQELFDKGEVYRPHRNRHRSEMQGEMAGLLTALCSGDSWHGQFEEHFNFVAQKCKWKEAAEKKESCRRQWQDACKNLQTKARKIADTRTQKEKRSVQVADVISFWQVAMEKIIAREYRKKRFSNRKIGKCPTQTEEGGRCGKNLPRKANAQIRALQFEIEARQMKILDGDSERNLSEAEIQEMCQQIKFCLNPAKEDKQHNTDIIDKWKTKRVKGDARGKKDSLRDIANGLQSGRAGFCVTHLKQKLSLLTDGKTTSPQWANLHQERVLGLDDAPPSIRQKAERAIIEIQKLLKTCKISADNIAHIGIETARFDINLLAEAEGKKKKTARDYQTSRRPLNKQAIAEQQGNKCFLCGGLLGGNIHTDHLAPQARGGANVRKNLVAMHDYCNIDKSKHVLNAGQISGEVLAILRENDPSKAEYLSKILDGGKLPQSTTAAPQHTMFGAKILRGALAKEFNIDAPRAKEIFCRPRASETAFLRHQWFEFMDRQKSALREPQRNPFALIFNIGEEAKSYKIQDLKLNPYFFPPAAVLMLKNGNGWLRIEDGCIVGEPTAQDAGGRNIIIYADNDKVILNAEITDEEESLKWEQKTAVGEDMEIPIRDICPPKWRKYRAHLNVGGWLQVRGDSLIGTVQRADGKTNIPWHYVSFMDDEGEEMGKVIIRAQNAYKKLRVAALPSKKDNIGMFHHIIDAAILAADVGWDKVLRLQKNISQQSFVERAKRKQAAAKENAPDFSHWCDMPTICIGETEHLCAPQKKDFVFKDAKKQSGNDVQKYDTEPYRVCDNELSQRIPLPNIKRVNIKYIMSEQIKEAMEKAWGDIDNLSGDDKEKAIIKQGKEDYFIAEQYFLALPPKHILHPHQTRAARCKRIDGLSVSSYDGLPDNTHKTDKRQNKTHYFRREEPWSEAFIYEQDDKKKVARAKAEFYWRDKKVPEYSSQDVPSNVEKIVTFNRGSLVRIDGVPGVWKISELSSRATMLPQDNDAREVANELSGDKRATYTKLELLKS